MLGSLIAIIIVTGVLAYLSTLVPAPSDIPKWAAFHVPFILYTIYGAFHIAAAGYFLRGMRGFTSDFKKAYRYITWGVIILGVTQLQTPILQATYLWSSPWNNWNGPDVMYLGGVVLILIGLRKFVALLGIKAAIARPAVIVGLLVFGAVIAMLIPYASAYGLSTVQYRCNLVIIMESAMVSVVMAALAFRVRRTIGAFYQKSSFWFALAVAGTAIGTAQTALMAFVGYNNFYVLYGFYSFVPVIVAMLYLRAGYSFMKMTRSQGRKTSNFSSIDLVVYADSLVSNHAGLESSLDKMRAVTSTIKSSRDLTDAHQATLQKVYLDIEAYLANDDPVRRYTKQELRTRIARQFDLDHNAQPLFWQNLPQ